jgi:hypothetical protein
LVARCQHLKFNFVPLIQNNMTRTISGKIFGISFGRHLLGSTLRNTGAREDRQPGGLATQHASCDTNTMSGWLMQAIYPGTSPETPKTVEMWAVWVSDQAKAAGALAEAAGVSDLPSATLCDLSDDDMRSLGLSEEGQVARVRCIF